MHRVLSDPTTLVSCAVKDGVIAASKSVFKDVQNVCGSVEGEACLILLPGVYRRSVVAATSLIFAIAASCSPIASAASAGEAYVTPNL